MKHALLFKIWGFLNFLFMSYPCKITKIEPHACGLTFRSLFVSTSPFFRFPLFPFFISTHFRSPLYLLLSRSHSFFWFPLSQSLISFSLSCFHFLSLNILSRFSLSLHCTWHSSTNKRDSATFWCRRWMEKRKMENDNANDAVSTKTFCKQEEGKSGRRRVGEKIKATNKILKFLKVGAKIDVFEIGSIVQLSQIVSINENEKEKKN